MCNSVVSANDNVIQTSILGHKKSLQKKGKTKAIAHGVKQELPTNLFDGKLFG